MAKETEIKILLTTDGKQTQATLKLTDDQVNKLKGSLKNLGGMDTQMRGFATTLRSVAGAMGLAFGAREIFNFMKSSIAEINRQEEVTRKLNATLESTGYAAGVTSQEVIALANNLEEINRFAFDDKDIIDASGLLLTFTKINKEIFPETMQLALDMSTRFDQDLKSSIVQIGKALNSPIDGVTALSRVGVQFSDQQKLLIKNFVEQNDLMSAQKIILDELSMQVSGSAAASMSDFAEKTERVNEALEQTKLLVGEGLTEVFSTLPILLKDVELGMEGVFQIAQNLSELMLNARLKGIFDVMTLPREYVNNAREAAKIQVVGKSPEEIRQLINRTNLMLNAIQWKGGKLVKLEVDDQTTVQELNARLSVYQNTLATLKAIEKEKDKSKKKIKMFEGDTEDIIPEHPEIINLDKILIGGRGRGSHGPAGKKIQAGFGAPAWQTMFSQTGADSLTAGVDAFWNNFINKQREAKDGWDAIWLAMKNTALKEIGDILSAQVWKSLLSLLAQLLPGVGSFLSFAPGAAKSSIALAAPGPTNKINIGSGINQISTMMDSKLDKFAAILESKQFRVRGEDIETVQTVLKKSKSTYGT